MKKNAFWISLILAVLAWTATDVQAQSHLGVHVGLNLDIEELYLGGSLQTGLSGNPRLFLYPSLDIYLIDNITLVGINGSLGYRLQTNSSSFEPYVGGGLTIFYASINDDGETDVDLNLLGGFLFNPRSSTQPFVELRLFIGDGTSAGVQGGVRFTI